MSKKNLKILIVVAIILIAIVVVTLLSHRNGGLYVNDDSVVGNTASNLYNGGLFCEVDGKVYFSNSSENGALCSMNVDETDVKKITSVSVASINCDGKRIFYAQTGKSAGSGLGYMRKATGLYSCTLKGNSVISYTMNAVGMATLCGNRLYYQKYEVKDGTYLYSVNIDKSDEKLLLEEFAAPASIYYGVIYYNGVNGDHYLHEYDPRYNTNEITWEHDVYNPVVMNDGWIYFIDLATDYELHKYNPSTGEEITLSDERVDLFNVIGNVVYYQVSTGDEPGLKRVLTDGSASDTIAAGLYSNICTTSKYVYFTPYDDESITYHASHNNPANYSEFIP